MEKEEIIAIERCLRLLERKQGWGSADKWSTQEFERLSEAVLDETSIQLSVATLKRLFGVVSYNSNPSATTLNALANYLGYENWRVFVESRETVNERKASVTKNKPGRQNHVMVWGSPFVILLIGFLGFNFLANKSVRKEYNPEDFEFSSEVMVTNGIPNSVVFEYDASSVEEGTPVHVQQSWDKRLSAEVSPEENIHTSIYYYPGFFIAKLVVDDQIVKEHGLYIKSDGWLSLIEQEKIPVYLDTNVTDEQQGFIAISADQVRKNNVPLQPKTPWVSIFNVGALEDVTTEDFVFETELKNDFSKGSGACQLTDIYLLLQGGAMSIPLSTKGCVSQLLFYDKDGKIENPSKLGVDFSKWVNVRFEMVNNEGKLFIDDQFSYDVPYPFGTRNVIGIRYRFQGAGSVNWVKIGKNDGSIIFSDGLKEPYLTAHSDL